jgi:hypothetical protein
VGRQHAPITTTHLKENYLRRNGLPRSDQAVLTEHWTRHRDYLTIVTVIEDQCFERAAGAQRQLVHRSRSTAAIFGREYAAGC